jgi:hypothetical protein
VPARAGQIAGAAGEDSSQNVMRLGQRALVVGGLGQLQGAPRQRFGPLGLRAAVRGQAPVGVQPRALAGFAWLAQCVERSLKVYLGTIPFAAPASGGHSAAAVS